MDLGFFPNSTVHRFVSFMKTTRASLLIRIRNTRDTKAWSEFYDLYAPLLYKYARARGLNHADAEDVQSTCYESIVKQILHFDYQKEKGGFKAWLKTLVNRRVIDLLRKKREHQADSQEIAVVQDDSPSVNQMWEEHWRKQHLRYCFRMAESQVSSVQYEAFRLLVEEDMSVASVCEKLNLNANQVYKAKSSVLKFVREMMLEVGENENES